MKTFLKCVHVTPIWSYPSGKTSELRKLEGLQEGKAIIALDDVKTVVPLQTTIDVEGGEQIYGTVPGVLNVYDSQGNSLWVKGTVEQFEEVLEKYEAFIFQEQSA